MTNLRVKQVQPPQEGYVHEKSDPEIAPNPEHGGLRVIDHGKHPLVSGHPARRHPEHASLARLGDNRERK